MRIIYIIIFLSISVCSSAHDFFSFNKLLKVSDVFGINPDLEMGIIGSINKENNGNINVKIYDNQTNTLIFETSLYKSSSIYSGTGTTYSKDQLGEGAIDYPDTWNSMDIKSSIIGLENRKSGRSHITPYELLSMGKELPVTIVVLLTNSTVSSIKIPGLGIIDEFSPINITSRSEVMKILTNATYKPETIFPAAHRARIAGYGTYPENSMSTILNTLKLGINILEIDLKTSSDGVVYLMHDNYLQRTTNFLDEYPGVGSGQDEYGRADHYTWAQLSRLILKTPEGVYTNEHIPTFKDVLEYVKNETNGILNLDINDDRTFLGAWNVVKELKAWDTVIFKTRRKTVDEFKNNYYNKLTEEEKKALIMFPIITATMNNPIQIYEDWEASGIPDGYEVSFRNNQSAIDKQLLEIVNRIHTKKRVRIHVFSSAPDTYKGRFKGNLNVNQCCNDAVDRRGDWTFLLDPNQTKSTKGGANGSFICDDSLLLIEFLLTINRYNP